jgi:hypothetical protein
VELRRRSAAIDRAAAADDAAVQPPRATGYHFGKGSPGVERHDLGGRRSSKERLPVGDQPPVAGAIQRLDKRAMLVLLRRLKTADDRRGVLAGHVQPGFAKCEHEHIHVARGARQPTQPGELGREVLDGVIREHVSDLAEKRARAPDRDPEVVQELRVERRTDARARSS